MGKSQKSFDKAVCYSLSAVSNYGNGQLSGRKKRELQQHSMVNHSTTRDDMHPCAEGQVPGLLISGPNALNISDENNPNK